MIHWESKPKTLKYLGDEEWQTEATLDELKLLSVCPPPCLTASPSAGTTRLQTSAAGYCATTRFTLKQGQEDRIFYKSDPNIVPLENGTTETCLL